MKHLIDGQEVELRTLSQEELSALIQVTQARIARADEELESLCAEVCRREAGNVIYLFGAPQDWEPRPA